MNFNENLLKGSGEIYFGVDKKVNSKSESHDLTLSLAIAQLVLHSGSLRRTLE